MTRLSAPVSAAKGPAGAAGDLARGGPPRRVCIRANGLAVRAGFGVTHAWFDRAKLGPGASAAATPTSLPPPDLSARPLIWFAPLPPMPTGPAREFTGSDDFMRLFSPGAGWDSAAARIDVFKLYGEWVAYHATDAELRAAVEGIASRGMTLAIEMGPLDPPADCGQGVESFAGIDEGRLISRRIREAGGTLQVIALDEPWYFAHVYSGPASCQWPVARVAEAVAGFVDAMRSEWPGLVVGDTEPTPSPVNAAGLLQWLGAYEAAAGEPFAFMHLDLDWSLSSWTELARAVDVGGDTAGVPVGVIYNGGSATSDAAWLAIAGKRVLAYEEAGASEHVVLQSWMDKPDHVLPEADPLTFTALVNRYFDDRAALGTLIGGSSNLAEGRPASASSSLGDATPDQAVDGVADTIWSSGGGPPAWIEVDLGQVRTIGEIRLLISQYPAGKTEHRITCRTSPGGASKALGTLAGVTSEPDTLTLTLASPASCRIVRIRTITSPSWVAWREIEIYPPS